MYHVYCQEKCIVNVIFAKRCLVCHSDFRFIYCIEIWAENLEKLSYKVWCRRSLAKRVVGLRRCHTSWYLIKESNDGPVAVVFSYSVTESMLQLLVYCLEPIQTICTHTAGSKAKYCGVKLELCAQKQFQAVCDLIYWFLALADDAVRYFSWSNWRALSGQRTLVKAECSTLVQFSCGGSPGSHLLRTQWNHWKPSAGHIDQIQSLDHLLNSNVTFNQSPFYEKYDLLKICDIFPMF